MSLSLGRNCFDSHVAVGSLQAERTLRPKLVPETCQCQQHTELPDEVELKVDGDSVEEPEEEPKWEPHSQSMAGQVKFNEGCLFEPPFVCAAIPVAMLLPSKLSRCRQRARSLKLLSHIGPFAFLPVTFVWGLRAVLSHICSCWFRSLVSWAPLFCSAVLQSRWGSGQGAASSDEVAVGVWWVWRSVRGGSKHRASLKLKISPSSFCLMASLVNIATWKSCLYASGRFGQTIWLMHDL